MSHHGLAKLNEETADDLAERFSREALPHRRVVAAYALKLCQHPEDAEDLVQDAFAAAYKSFHRFKEGTNCSAWLHRIAFNTFANGYRKNKRDRERAAIADANELWSSVSADAPECPERSALSSDVMDEIRARIQELPDGRREAFQLFAIEGRSYNAISIMMGIPVGTVMSRIHRARKELRKTTRGLASEHGVTKVVEERGEMATHISNGTAQKILDAMRGNPPMTRMDIEASVGTRITEHLRTLEHKGFIEKFGKRGKAYLWNARGLSVLREEPKETPKESPEEQAPTDQPPAPVTPANVEDIWAHIMVAASRQTGLKLRADQARSLVFWAMSLPAPPTNYARAQEKARSLGFCPECLSHPCPEGHDVCVSCQISKSLQQ